MILFGFIDLFFFFYFGGKFLPFKGGYGSKQRDPKTKTTKQAVCHRVCGLATYIKKYLKAKEK
jgi:hypothetical protein